MTLKLSADNSADLGTRLPGDAKAKKAKASNRNNRTSRDQSKRENADEPRERTPILAARPSNLINIPARSGFVQRYVRMSYGSTEDVDNVSRKMNEGWKPREASTIPKGVIAPKIRNGDYTGYIGVRGNILMERPIALHKQYGARNRMLTQHQMDVVEQQLHAEHRPGKGLGKPKIKIQSEVGVRKARPAQVQDDDDDDLGDETE